MLVLSARSGALASRIGPRLQMSVGPVVMAVGLALFIRVGSSGNYVTEVLPAVLVFGLGLAINVAPLTATVLAAASPQHAGMASAVNNDVARAASLIAVAVLPAAAGLGGAAYLNAPQFSAGFHQSRADLRRAMRSGRHPGRGDYPQSCPAGRGGGTAAACRRALRARRHAARRRHAGASGRDGQLAGDQEERVKRSAVSGSRPDRRGAAERHRPLG